VEQKTIVATPKSWERFSLSFGERAGVREDNATKHDVSSKF
jgi:hypothetical protein